jgi:hypothetical protein
VLIVIALVLGLLLIPDTASAWGPISHLAHGSEALKNITILGAGLQQLLTRYPMEYLYGCVGADITLAKKYTRAMQAHCHSWEVGWRILDAAESDAQRAFAYGYLSHLAADVYSHNHFVPTQLVVSFSARTLRHVYWEARFDSMQNPDYRGIVRDLRRQEFPECDALVKRVVARTIFSFNTNKRLFNSLMLLNRLQQWQKMLRSLNNASKWTIDEEDRGEYLSLARQSAMSVLAQMEQSPFWKADPTGERALKAAQMIRKNLNLLWLDGKLTAESAEMILMDMRSRFREALTRPEELLALLSGY